MWRGGWQWRKGHPNCGCGFAAHETLHWDAAALLWGTVALGVLLLGDMLGCLRLVFRILILDIAGLTCGSAALGAARNARRRQAHDQ